MNPIKKMFEDMSDGDLFKGIEEIRESEETGIIPEGIVRECATKLKDYTNGTSMDLNHVINGILKESAYRWYKMYF